MEKHEHDLLYAHCAACKSDNMKVQFSDAHGLVIACYNCGKMVFNAQNGDHLDVQLARISNQGCAHEHEHRGEKKN